MTYMDIIESNSPISYISFVDVQGRVARAKPQREDVVMLSSDDEAQMSFLAAF